MVFSLFFSLFDLFRKVAKNDNAEKEEGIKEKQKPSHDDEPQNPAIKRGEVND